MASRLQPPFTIHWSESAFWVQDASGMAFGYCYFDDREHIGTFEPRMSRRLAEQTVKFIARQATAWAETKGGERGAGP